ncbi:MAG: Gfo/Idh/MocA family oxidoreductase [Deltaproteobacteria bacterium]|nr:Gfo/Idh/MocA family oxidoreductase [Deltaproteobacteria bacterium]
MKRDIRVGILGCGVAAEHHIDALRYVPHIDLIWFCDIIEAKAINAANQWGENAKSGADVNDLLIRHRPDTVHICTPPSTHSELTIKALESGCHVLLEKPMATINTDAKRIVHARDMSGKQVCLMHNHMFDPPILKARQLIEKGAIGHLVYGEARYFLSQTKKKMEDTINPDHWAYKLPSGIAGEYLPHPIYLLQSFFGPCYELQFQGKSMGKTANNSQMLRGYALQLQFHTALGRILMIDNMDYDHFSIDIYGTRAAIHINMMDLTYSIERQRSGVPLVLSRVNITVEQSIQRLVGTLSNFFLIATGRLKRRPGHKLLIKKVYHAIRNNMPMPIPIEDGLEQVHTMDMLNDLIAQQNTL